VNLRFVGTAGVSPATSNGFTQDSMHLINREKVAFHENGRDARDPRKRLIVISESG
jgi:hypothetical protein